ncbi:hypothetical protein H5407_13640 [Mitsuaria sp. WAJ17]|uniref:hypothetical protein n=1 Tax=Mitsuaria sp. WAJ17 TaxID=2761452 RepID=UPI0016028E57|nr:hypothetical protein [Mitsuaria sp. WAJ17]MBB2486260.1 hypothetical protein [Mitsuaria sp. WAJ17]
MEELIRELVDFGRAEEVALLMDGDSKYYSGSVENIPTSIDEVYVFRMATEHLKFVAKYGQDVKMKKVDGHVFSAYPEYFEQWVSGGCRGVCLGDVKNYLKEHPLSSR